MSTAKLDKATLTQRELEIDHELSKSFVVTAKLTTTGKVQLKAVKRPPDKK